MLVLTRRVDEVIVINDEILITVVSVTPTKVKIGITAPRTCQVDRLEVYRQKKKIQKALEEADALNGV